MTRKSLLWTSIFFLTFAIARDQVPLEMPVAAPRQVAPVESNERTVFLSVEYDETFLRQHGRNVEQFLRDAIAITNVEWRRYRRDWFELGELRFRPSGDSRDASYLLARFTQRTSSRSDTVHVRVVGRPLEVYTSGTGSMAIGGLAYRGSDALIISSSEGVVTELFAYYLFHELGHSWDAFDIPFGGGHSTFGAKVSATFEIDAGNEEIIDASDGPDDRSSPRRGPAVIQRKLAGGRAVTKNHALYRQMADLLLHEPSPSNPAYVEKKTRVLAAAGSERRPVATYLAQFEMTPHQRQDDDTIRKRIAEHYWLAHRAIGREEYALADCELQQIQQIYETVPDVHMLVSAVERKIRKKRAN